MKRKYLIIIGIIAAILFIVGVNISAAESGTLMYTFSIGDAVTAYYYDNGLLEIKGSGGFEYSDPEYVPDLRDQVIKISIIGEGIEIPEKAFCQWNMETVEMSGTVYFNRSKFIRGL